MSGNTKNAKKVVLTVYVPIVAADAVRSALAAAGAGRIGKYAGCSFSAPGVGRFLPLDGAHPAVGVVGEMAEVAEERIEAVVDGEVLPTVLRAARAAHPYEEPVILVTPLLDADALPSGDVPCAPEP